MIRDIFQNEILLASEYMNLEQQSLDQIRAILTELDWISTDGHIWHLDDRRVFLRLVDDISTVIKLHHLSVKDTVITDNYIAPAVSARVFTLPKSWWGMYAYHPQPYDISELRDYSFLVNRIDASRMRLMLAISKRKHLHDGVINFNCVTPSDWGDVSHETRLKNWNNQWQELGPAIRDHYIGDYQRLTNKMPFRNHDFTHEQALWASRLNIVVETYSGDDVIAFSEKTFTALCVPRPWVLFGGRGSVARLRRLGFDVLDDLVDHSYDHLTKIQDKYPRFVDCSVQSMMTDIDQNRSRLESASQHNQNLLHKWRDVWKSNFHNWLTDLEKALKIS
jgi:hypothetical protein